MATVRWWSVLSAVAAPILLIGGWTVAAARQPAFDPVRETISALAGLGATDRWLMTGVFVAVGLCHLVTASGLLVAGRPGRVLIGLGGIGSLLVAVFPVPVVGSSTAHTLSAALVFGCLTVWPAVAALRPGAGTRPWVLRPVAGLVVTVLLAAALAWYVLVIGGPEVAGLAERVAAGGQAVWPLVVVLVLRFSRGSTQIPRPVLAAEQR